MSKTSDMNDERYFRITCELLEESETMCQSTLDAIRSRLGNVQYNKINNLLNGLMRASAQRGEARAQLLHIQATQMTAIEGKKR